ncbi:MAG: hypothetical protein HY719_00910 [Planctomycetes bacterium]|nr:hypothetical protein [Planctomycetota bacterium]
MPSKFAERFASLVDRGIGAGKAAAARAVLEELGYSADEAKAIATDVEWTRRALAAFPREIAGKSKVIG